MPQKALPAALIILLAIACYLIGEPLENTLIFDRIAISQGDFWRVFSCHLLHTNHIHLVLNIAGLLLLYGLHRKFYSAKNYLSIFLSAALIVSMGIYFFSPQLQYYVGLSGVLHSIFVWGALLDIRSGDKTGYLLFIGAIVKVAHEQYFGASEQVAKLIAANVAIDAHLYGVVAGILFFMMQSIQSNRFNKLS